MPKCHFNKVALHIFRIPFPKKTSGGLLQYLLQMKVVFNY